MSDIVDWHRSELLHINSALERESGMKSREAARWKRRRRGHERTIQEIQSLRRRLANIIGECGQEGRDGEPWDTIQAIATGEYDPCGSRTAEGEGA